MPFLSSWFFLSDRPALDDAICIDCSLVIMIEHQLRTSGIVYNVSISGTHLDHDILYLDVCRLSFFYRLLLSVSLFLFPLTPILLLRSPLFFLCLSTTLRFLNAVPFQALLIIHLLPILPYHIRQFIFDFFLWDEVRD